MGSLTDNLLRLTEFPFSYSFIGLLAWIFGGKGLLNEESLSNLGPLLIIMGFVATTLSITDPFGALLRYLLREGYLPEKGREKRHEFSEKEFRDEFLEQHYWYHTGKQPSEEDSTKLHLLGQGERQDQDEKLYVFGKNKEELFGKTRLLRESRSIRLSLSYDFLTWGKIDKNKSSAESSDEYTSSDEDAEVKIEDIKKKKERDYVSHKKRYGSDVYGAIKSLRGSTLRTDWVRREIDKITSMIYFIMVVGLFILALIFYPDFRDRFVLTFQGGNQTDAGDATIGSNQTAGDDAISSACATTGGGNSTLLPSSGGSGSTVTGGGGGGGGESGGRGNQSSPVRLYIEQACVALQSGDAQGALMQLNSALNALSSSGSRTEQILVATILIVLFSGGALGVVIYMLSVRLKDLSRNALTAFQFLMTRLAYLIARRGIKEVINVDEDFKNTLDEIEEKYLNNGNWALSEFSVRQLINDYRDLFFKRPKLTPDEYKRYYTDFY